MVSPIDHFSSPSMSISEFFRFIDDQNQNQYPSKPTLKSPIGSQIKPSKHESELQDLEENQQFEYRVSSKPTLNFPNGSQIEPSNHEFEFQYLQQCETREVRTPILGKFEFRSKRTLKYPNWSQIKPSNHESQVEDLQKNQQGKARVSSNQLKLPLLCNFDATHEDDDDDDDDDERFINQSLMSNSEFYLLKNNQNQIELEIPSKPTLNFPNGSLKSPLFGEFEATNEDDNDGFRTPTSLEHKIPVMKECPPAPRKPLPPPSPSPSPSRKRRSSMSPRVPRNPPITVKEIEAMFPLIVQEDEGQKIKKARK